MATIVVGAAAIALLGLLFAELPRFYNQPSVVAPESDSVSPQVQAATETSVSDPALVGSAERELHQRFEQAVMMLHAGKYEYAIAALNRVLELAPKLPEAHVNMGYALLGMENYNAALKYFNSAVDLSPGQANAYFGMAVALDATGERRAAISAMDLYLHLADKDDPFIRKARSALWEWRELPKSAVPTVGPAEERSPTTGGVATSGGGEDAKRN